ncbi:MULTISPECIES: glycine oxidase ThiO [unclassified Streptomyces]|uniref:glycine oxidase ThiO n=1 Tax=unclassified Streptomyces TaxID=2593676 RepID=UPI002DDA642F|nr:MULTISPECIES: glycine oxidase ThiO [unclassified Streptomyces]WSF87235.1 glycine oxidase ThiO [Streptomyces sp. NBC_01744]WSC36523.1 glycine oxidase ThiO [Streptomyces sp. NBC_01763]WSC44620.1 glycine oxidase ThiO [Streptomyces sp. NBC_01762]WSC56397.1 glycine oxidase ThiO [Streptomyces sp. NBC_01761]WSD24207.1 glycine oxidase ThiO [Streptomyces sp. NBC_01751]
MRPSGNTSADGSGVPGSDVLVIGGGIIGLVTAWRAAQRGLRTAVVDPDPGGGAARVAAGMLAAVTELHYGEQMLLGLNVASAARYPDFAAELEAASGQDIGFRACGTLAVALDSDDRAHLRELHALQHRSGLQSEWLTGRECRRLEPMLAPGVRGGLRVDGDHQVDPRRLAAALLTACERTGVVFHRDRAERLVVVRDRAAGAVLATGTELAADQIVLAAGSLSGRLAGLPDEVVPPVRPVKGQVLRLSVPAAYAPFLTRTVRAVVRGSHVYLVPRENGELVVGATSEEMGWDTTVTAGGVYELLRDAHELVPGITELPLTETRAGLRPASPDNAPLLGPTALPGLHLATGHHRNGVLLTPVTGDAMAELLTTGELPAVARPFTPGRFAPAVVPPPAAPPAAARQEQPA